MNKKTDMLYEELLRFNELDSSLYVGNYSDIFKCDFDTDKLYFAHLKYKVNDAFKQSDFIYLFEEIKYGDVVLYKEIFSGNLFEKINFRRVFYTRNMFLGDIICYKDYASNITFLEKHSCNVLTKIKINN